MDNLIFKDSGKTQFVFQKIKIQLQHGRNPNTRSSYWKSISPNRRRKDQGSKRVEDTD